jgi:hypothetical protein
VSWYDLMEREAKLIVEIFLVRVCLRLIHRIMHGLKNDRVRLGEFLVEKH